MRPPRLPPVFRPLVRALNRPVVVRLAALALLVFSVSRMVAPVTYSLEAGDLRFRLRPALPGGHTILGLGPFGELRWTTHAAPVDVEATFVFRSTVRELPEPAELGDLRALLVREKAPWVLATGMLIGAIVVTGSGRRRAIASGIGGVALAGVVAATLGASVLTYDAAALDRPQYRGPIEGASRVLQLVHEVRRDWEGVRRNINKVVQGLQRLHQEVVLGTAPAATDTVRLLVIADIHNNPIGLMIADELVTRFAIDGILNAGDFTDKGTGAEAELFARFGTFTKPHVVAAGNHEDVAAITRLNAIRGVTILDSRTSDVTTVDGLTILGDRDPNSRAITTDPANELGAAQLPVLCERLRARFDVVSPAIVLVHDPALGRCAATRAEEAQQPLAFVWGHLHKQAYEERGTVVSVSPGTSGANGFKSAVVSPYGFAMLEFDRASRTLISTCLFQLDGPQRLRSAACHMRPRVPGATP